MRSKGGMILTVENRSIRGITSRRATSSNTNLTWNGSELNSGLPIDRPATKRPNHGRAVKHKIKFVSDSKQSLSTLNIEIDSCCIQNLSLFVGTKEKIHYMNWQESSQRSKSRYAKPYGCSTSTKFGQNYFWKLQTTCVMEPRKACWKTVWINSTCEVRSSHPNPWLPNDDEDN
jgi:hypothetical protein